MALKRFLEAGQIVSTHGIAGELRIQPWCDSPGFLAGFGTLYLDDAGNKPLKVLSARPHKSLLLVRFEGVDSMDEAVRLIRRVVYLDRQDVTLPEGSFFEQDLIGLEVTDAGNGRRYGTLTSVGRTGANDIYAVRAENGTETWIPAIRDVIRHIDPVGGKMLITPLKGLFDDED